MKSVSQLFQLAILLPIWMVLAAVVVISEFLDRRRSDEPAIPVAAPPDVEPRRNRSTRHEVVLTTRAAQV